MERSGQRDLHDALWRSHGGFDLVLGPVLLALVGLWLDRTFGLTPLLTIAFLVFGAVGAVLKTYYDFQRRMTAAAERRARLEAETEALRAAAGPARAAGETL